MLKKKLASIAAAAVLAACSIGTTAFATTYGVTKYDFGPITLYGGQTGYVTRSVTKEDNLSAWVRVDRGLSRGDTYVTFQVKSATGTTATAATDLWINGEHYINYLPNQGENGKNYYLKFYMESQANADSIYIDGVWAP